MVLICVSSANGESFEIELGPTNQVHELKAHIDAAWQIPSVFQNLCVGERVLLDSDLLGDCCTLGSLIASMVISLQIFDKCNPTLDYGDRETIQHALGELVRLGSRGGNAVTSILIDLLGHCDYAIPGDAVRALRKAVNKGDQHVVKEILERYWDDPDVNVTLNAAEALGHVAQTGDEKVIQVMLASLKDAKRQELSLHVLGKVSKRGDHHVMKAIIAGLEDTSRERMNVIKMQTLQTLRKIACQDDPDTLGLLRAHLLHTNSDVRGIALDTLAGLGVADPVTNEAVLACLLDVCQSVKRSALQCLEKIVKKEDARAIAAVNDLFENINEDDDVRSYALDTLCQIVSNQQAITASLMCARDSLMSISLRRTGFHNLQRLAKCCDCNVALEVTACLQDSQRRIRHSALYMLQEIARLCDKDTLAAIFTCLELETDGYGRGLVVQSLLKIVKKGDAHAIALASDLLTHKESAVRLAACGILRSIADYDRYRDTIEARLRHENADVRKDLTLEVGHIARKGDRSIIEILSAQLQDDDVRVRTSTVDVLGRVAEIGDKHIIVAAIDCLKDEDYNVRWSAVDVLENIATKETIDQQVIDAMMTCAHDENYNVSFRARCFLGQV